MNISPYFVEIYLTNGKEKIKMVHSAKCYPRGSKIPFFLFPLESRCQVQEGNVFVHAKETFRTIKKKKSSTLVKKNPWNMTARELMFVWVISNIALAHTHVNVFHPFRHSCVKMPSEPKSHLNLSQI